MAVKLSSIIPKEIHTQIPVIIQDPESGEHIIDSITVYSPTLERIEAFHEMSKLSTDDSSILLSLIQNFTDMEVEESDVKNIMEATGYFGEVFDNLQFELYRILTTIIKQGFKTRELIYDMDEEYLQKLEEEGFEQVGVFKEIRNMSKKRTEKNGQKNI